MNSFSRFKRKIKSNSYVVMGSLEIKKILRQSSHISKVKIILFYSLKESITIFLLTHLLLGAEEELY